MRNLDPATVIKSLLQDPESIMEAEKIPETTFLEYRDRKAQEVPVAVDHEETIKDCLRNDRVALT